MTIVPGLTRVRSLDVEATRRQAALEGIATFVMPGTGVEDVASLFQAIRDTFPLDPPLFSARSWDALSDSLWEGLYTYDAKRILILWPGADSMALSAPDFETALSVFAEVAKNLADPKPTCGAPKEVAILVETIR